MSSNSFISGIQFHDEKYFPYGFSRSGDFNLEQAKTLTHCGFIMQQLAEGKISAENEEQEHFLLVINGTVEPLYLTELTYLKYLEIIQKKETVIDFAKKHPQLEF